MKGMLLNCSILLFFFAGAFAHFQIPGLPIVVIPEYTAFGLKNTTHKGTEANLYLGLPYVKPPERFEVCSNIFIDIHTNNF